MNTSAMPPELPISRKSITTLAIESWRIMRTSSLFGNAHAAASLQYAARQFSEVLAEMNIELVDLTGRSYDPGMAPEVVDVQDDPKLGAGVVIIAETISPTVMWRGQVIEAGQIGLRRGYAIAHPMEEHQ